MVNEIAVAAIGVFGTFSLTFMWHKYKMLEERHNNKCFSDEWKRRWNQADNSVRELSKQLGDANTEKLKYKKAFEELAKEHNELKEKHAPLAALNPFERQAVEAVTNQSTLDEWMNGPREVK